jgi:hypothetical protein
MRDHGARVRDTPVTLPLSEQATCQHRQSSVPFHGLIRRNRIWRVTEASNALLDRVKAQASAGARHRGAHVRIRGYRSPGLGSCVRTGDAAATRSVVGPGVRSDVMAEYSHINHRYRYICGTAARQFPGVHPG